VVQASDLRVGGLIDLQEGAAKLFRGRLVRKAHRLVYHLTLGSRLIKKKGAADQEGGPGMVLDERMDRVEALAVARTHLLRFTVYGLRWCVYFSRFTIQGSWLAFQG